MVTRASGDARRGLEVPVVEERRPQPGNATTGAALGGEPHEHPGPGAGGEETGEQQTSGETGVGRLDHDPGGAPPRGRPTAAAPGGAR